MTVNRTKFRTLAAGLAAIGLALAGCAAEDPADAVSRVTLSDPWVKAADSGMTAMFGTLTNNSDTDLTLTGVTSPASPRVELHETADDGAGAMVMREKADGMALPAGESYTLEPGADHVMLFDLPGPVPAGGEVPLTFRFGDAGAAEFAAQVRDFAGAKESYDTGAHGG